MTARTACGVGILLVTLLLTETALRLAGCVPTLGYSDVPVLLARPHPRLGYVLPPNTTITYAGVQTRLNALGLRDALPASGPVSVIALGDELTFGWGVSDDETYPHQLGGLLPQLCVSCGGVLNAGVPGYTSYQGVLLLRELLTQWRPRVVVVGFSLNDDMRDGPLQRILGQLDAPPRARAIHDWLLQYSTLYARLRGRLASASEGWQSIESRTAENEYGRYLHAMLAESKRVGARVVLLNIGFDATAPMEVTVAQRRHRRGLYESGPHDAMRALASEHGFSLAEFGGPELNATTMFDALHPNATGYRLIAERVAAVIRDHSLLPAGSEATTTP